MSSRLRVFDSSVGIKLLIGLTGLALFVYLIIHVTGNALVIVGPDAFNGFHETMTANPLLVFLLHIYKTITMYLRNRQTRPVRYQVKKRAGSPSRKTLASSTMIFTGLWLVAFLVVHVRAFRFPPHYETPTGAMDLYRIELENLGHPLTVAFYVLTMLIVGSHLWHGASSALQSLGFDHPRWTPLLLALGKVAAVSIAGGFIAITLWVFFVGGRP
jgi:succinate dehydrogenase / fumarate reductase, cytochrome b subunit